MRKKLNRFSYGEIRSDEFADCVVYRIYDSRTGQVACDVQGRYPYVVAKKKGDVPAASNPSTTSKPAPVGGKWLFRSDALKAKKFAVSSEAYLASLCTQLNDLGEACVVTKLSIDGTPYWVIAGTSDGDAVLVYADRSGYPFVASVTEAPAAADQAQNYYTQTTNNTTNNYDYGTTVEKQIIDNSVTNNNYVDESTSIGTLNIIKDESTTNEYNIESLYYDASTKSYIANTYQVDYDPVNNYYTYDYYTYNIQYNITNTYVTYIGSNDAYKQEQYKYYYELPDGRSSADLTADEIAGMSFQFHDCVNYARSATDTSLRALYHFDGDTDDSGYFGTQTKFTWNTGASITYMDSDPFGGALYLDETAHNFTVTLPSALGSGDFTVQWRYYQASQADTADNRENKFSIGNSVIFSWDERSYYMGTTKTVCAPVGIGTWNEVALVRQSTTLYLYVNGLKVGTTSINTPYGNAFTFTFGSTSRAYSMLDELRVVNFAIAKGGASYTPTSVPYDTNLVLVLPDSAFPIADEYYDFDLPDNALFASPFNLGRLPVGSSAYTNNVQPGSVKLAYSDNCTTVSAGYPSMSYTDSALLVYQSDVQEVRYYYDSDSYWRNGSFLPSGDYTFTVVTADGQVHSLSVALVLNSCSFQFSDGDIYSYDFNLLKSGSGCAVNGSYRFKYLDCGSFWMAVRSWDGTPDSYSFCSKSFLGVTFRVVPKGGQFVDIMYASVIPGTEPDDAVKKVSCIYSSEEVKPNTAAIQSDIPIHGYTVGGVRPTFPARGDVWMSVTGSRISGVQIYNGRAWEETNARYYTGTRWIPIYAFDIYTLEDCWDIADGEDVIPPITSENDFFRWWQQQWLDFRKWLEQSPSSPISPSSPVSPGSPGNSGSPGSDGDGSNGGFLDAILDAISGGLASLIRTLFDLVTQILELVVNLVFDLLGFFFNLITETVISGIGGLIAAFTNGSLLAPFQQTVITVDPEGNEVQTTMIGLSSGVATVFTVFSGMIMALPVDLRSILIFGIAALAFVAIFRLVKS